MNSRNQILLTGERDRKKVITMADHTGKVFKEITSMCPDHYPVHFITELPSDPNYIVQSCLACDVIWSYNINSGERKIVYDKCKPWAMCEGPDQTLLVANTALNLLQFK